ncbi:MAG: FxLYD domain-containing protein [Bauldia sp.]|nr:FxLYD domain-containing protein [Bauldia sp.]MCW5718641.1 FxLYD domain-containing protein [Bauldia sp.]
MERADRRAEDTALAVMPATGPVPRTRHRPPVIIDIHPGFVRLPPAVRGPAVRKRHRPALLAALAGLATATVLIALRHPIVEAVPQLGGIYGAIGLPVNLQGVELDDLRASRIFRGGYEQLRVEGAILSVARKTVALPPIEVILLGADGAEIGRRTAVVAASVIAPRGTIRFATEFPDLPSEAATITVRLGDGRPFEVH